MTATKQAAICAIRGEIPPQVITERLGLDAQLVNV